MKRLIILALMCAGAAHAQVVPKGRVDDVPDDVRQAVIDRMQRTFIYPMLVIWKFDFIRPYPTDGIAICGRLNFPDSTRHYVGEQPFFAHMSGGRVTESGIVARRQNEDPVLANANAYKIACGTG